MTSRQKMHFMVGRQCTPLELLGGLWVPWIGRDMLAEESIVANRHQLFHCLCYLHEGEGEFSIDGHAFPVTAGTLTAFTRGQLISQHPKMQRPWDLYWIQFDGPVADALFAEFGWTADAQPISIGTMTRFPSFFDEMFEAQFLEPYGSLILQGLAVQLLGYLGQLPHGLSMNVAVQSDSPVIHITSYLAQHYAEPLTLQEIADQFCISRSHLIRIFRKITASTPMDYLDHIRINRALALISKGKPINEVAVEVGIPEMRTFYRVFKRVKGYTPLQFRDMRSRLEKRLLESSREMQTHSAFMPVNPLLTEEQ